MSISGDSSPTGKNAPPRKRLTLGGRSTRLDPTTHALRADLADVELADRVFAPHYARAVTYRTVRVVEMRLRDGEPVGQLDTGDTFDVLDISGGYAWGKAGPRIGYVPMDALTPA